MVTTLWLATPVAWPWYTVIGSLTTLLTGAIAHAVGGGDRSRAPASG